MTILAFFVLGWFICAAISASIFLGHFQRKFSVLAEEEYREDLGKSWLVGLMGGPVTLAIALFMSGFCEYGLMNPFVLNRCKGTNND